MDVNFLSFCDCLGRKRRQTKGKSKGVEKIEERKGQKSTGLHLTGLFLMFS